ncbi:MAG: hypothetical protein NVS3B14_21430 [Ktedonobacteraceae bacterium]
MNDRPTLWLILGFGGVFAITMTFVYPGTAIDIYVYIAQSIGFIQYHANPITIPPATIAKDPLITLAGGWAYYPAPYGPLGIVIDAIPTLVLGRNLLANLVLIKLIFSAMLIIEAFLVFEILSRYAPKYALAGALFLAWNPYALFEFSANGHNDIAMMFFVMIAVLDFVENRMVLALVFVVASALVKFAMLPLIPLFFIYSVVHQPTNQKRLIYVVLATVTSLALIIVVYGPFWQGTKTLAPLLFQDQRYMSSFSTMLTDITSGNVTLDQAKLLGRILFGAIYVYALFLATRSKISMLQGCFITLFFLLALGVTNFEIWYAIWPAMFAILLPRVTTHLSVILFMYGSALSVTIYYYIWVWLGFTASALAFVNDLAYLMVFGPALLLLFGFALQRWLSVKQVTGTDQHKIKTSEAGEVLAVPPP